mmetsp:Transcript_18099/g.51509  ORF Transcript_18099/g.51509 Transcript_18099/m.51509 type:complete len:219 (-) Transcript_18099:1803-2459(-)
MDAIAFPSVLDPRRKVDGVTEELESGLLTAQHARRHAAGVQAESHGQNRRIASNQFSEILDHQQLHGSHALVSEERHDDGMVLLWLGKSGHGDVAIADRLDLEYFAFSRYFVEFTVQRLQQQEHVARFMLRAPRSKSGNVGEQNRRIFEGVGNRSTVVPGIVSGFQLGIHETEGLARVIVVVVAIATVLYGVDAGTVLLFGLRCGCLNQSITDSFWEQ